jgi:ATP-dependent Lhr-like helicase
MSAPDHVAITTPTLTEPQLFSALHPELAAWFAQRFTHFSPAQRATVPEILAGHSTLLSAPTGSGKTLAAFLGVFDYLAKLRASATLPNGIVAVYISPLRALAYDLHKNLQQPLTELGWDWLRVGARTGDTPAKDRAAQKRRPPHILVTTPESLTLLVSQPSWTPAFRHARFLIIDELHALAENKRGSLLMVTAERLEDLVNPPASDQSKIDGQKSKILRIGLSATVAPLPTVASFLVGPTRSARIVEIAQRKPARIEVFSPLERRAYPAAGHTAARVMRQLATFLGKTRTTLIFTNTRGAAELIGLRLKQLLPDLAPLIEVHHASIDRSVRLEVEDRLKRGELRAVVCSSSLELGIDIGSIDTVVLISAPKGVARALQRIGRSGHSMDRTSHGVLVATNINDLAECAVTARMMDRRELEPVRINENPVDVLAQSLVGLAVFTSVTPDDAFALVRRTFPFRTLTRENFDRVLRYLDGGGVSLERAYRDTFGKVIVNAEGHLAHPRTRTARDYFQNIGTISSESMITVKVVRRNLGQLEESFLKRMRPGDVFVLNGRALRLVSTSILSAKAVAADGSLPTVPRWGAKMPLASGLGDEVVRLRTEVSRLLGSAGTSGPGHAAAHQFLRDHYALTDANATALLQHFSLQAEVSVIPTSAFFLIELYRDPRSDLLHYFFHSLIGRSANDALSRIVAQRVQATRGGNALVTIDDYGFLLTLKPFQALDTADDWRPLFRRVGAEDDLRLALAESELVKWQFRGVAQTGLMVPRRTHGAERGARALQWSSEIIFEVLRKYEPDHPLLAEAYADATLRFLDLPRAIRFFDDAAALPWQLQVVERVSPFSFGIFVSKLKETMTLEDPETTIERLYHEMYGIEK